MGKLFTLDIRSNGVTGQDLMFKVSDELTKLRDNSFELELEEVSTRNTSLFIDGGESGCSHMTLN